MMIGDISSSSSRTIGVVSTAKTSMCTVWDRRMGQIGLGLDLDSLEAEFTNQLPSLLVKLPGV